MAVTAWKNPGQWGLMANDWVKALRASTEDGLFASSDPKDAGQDEENYEKWGFAIPTGDTIDGIEIRVLGNLKEGTNATKIVAQLHRWTGLAYALMGIAQDIGNWSDNVLVERFQGGATDVWGWTGVAPADVNGVQFGVKLHTQSVTSQGDKLDVDVVQMRVYHSSAGGAIPTLGYRQYRQRRIG